MGALSQTLPVCSFAKTLVVLTWSQESRRVACFVCCRLPRLREFFLALAINHSVMLEEVGGKLELVASSPDEQARPPSHLISVVSN